MSRSQQSSTSLRPRTGWIPQSNIIVLSKYLTMIHDLPTSWPAPSGITWTWWREACEGEAPCWAAASDASSFSLSRSTTTGAVVVAAVAIVVAYSILKYSSKWTSRRVSTDSAREETTNKVREIAQALRVRGWRSRPEGFSDCDLGQWLVAIAILCTSRPYC